MTMVTTATTATTATAAALAAADSVVSRFATLLAHDQVVEPVGPVRLGIDLGTANIVVSVVDAANEPVAGATVRSTVVRDGVVVDWHGATTAVRGLVDHVSARLGTRFEEAAVTIPPGIGAGTVKVFTNVAEAAGLRACEVVDEPVAAARVLGLRDGAVIDLGHGTTGVSVMADGVVRRSVDQATGGHHMTLVLAGTHGIGYDEAEALKRDPARSREVEGAVRPTLEKMAQISRDALAGLDVPVVYLVGGASSFPVAPAVFEDALGVPVLRPSEPLWVTPLGAAMRPDAGGGAR